MNEGTYKKIIQTIHSNWYNGGNFALWQVRDNASVSASSAIRIVRKLVELRLLIYTQRQYENRNYVVAACWSPNVNIVIENFELAKLMRI